MVDDAQGTLPPGTVFNRYTITRCIGAGGMGAVYEATHTDLKKRVAVKVLDPNLCSNAEALTRFLREGEATARIRHPNVVDIADIGVHEGQPYLVMEFLEGEDLAKLLAREGRLSVAHTVDLLLPVVGAVAAAHEVGIIHRDLKPDNVFLARTRQGVQPKLLDFGISKLLGAMPLTGMKTLIGTPYYMSPEQARGGSQDVGPRSDQYSFAVVLYECVTGTKPFQGRTMYEILCAIATTTPMAPSQAQSGIPIGLDAVLARAMNRNVAERFPSIVELGAALLPFASPALRTVWAPVFSHVAFRDDGEEAATVLTPDPVLAKKLVAVIAPKVRDDNYETTTRMSPPTPPAGVEQTLAPVQHVAAAKNAPDLQAQQPSRRLPVAVWVILALAALALGVGVIAVAGYLVLRS